MLTEPSRLPGLPQVFTFDANGTRFRVTACEQTGGTVEEAGLVSLPPKVSDQ